MKKALALGISLLALASPVSATMQVIDHTQIAKTGEVIKQTTKTREAAEGTLETTNKVLDQAETINKALGDGAKVGVDAFGWLNSATNSANNAMAACGIDGFIPPLKGLDIPGIDLPDMDLTCIKSAVKAVEDGLYTFHKLKETDPTVTIKPGSGEYAAKRNRPHYYAVGQEELLKRQRAYRIKTIKNVQAAANRQSDMGSEVLSIENKLATIGKDPHDINSLLRILISVELAQLKAANEHYAAMAKYMDMEAAQLMDQVPLKQVDEEGE